VAPLPIGFRCFIFFYLHGRHSQLLQAASRCRSKENLCPPNLKAFVGNSFPTQIVWKGSS
jgi:hypothetical protein